MSTKIPRLMCTQHPDSTVSVPTSQEVDEAIQCNVVYGCDEVMPDYEGKLTPYSQPKDIVIKSIKLGVAIGEKFFVTPRIPNPSLEEFDKVDLSIEAGIIANYYSLKLMGTQATRWLILPMVEDQEIVRIVQRIILKKISIIREEIGANIEEIQLVPLLEDSKSLVDIRRYVDTIMRVLNEFGNKPEVLRIFLGKSDAAVKSGHIASSLSVIFAQNALRSISREVGVKIKTIIGMGSPPFRGGLNNPGLVNYIVRTYAGFSTATIQSAIRYDVSYNDYKIVKNAIVEAIEREDKGVLETLNDDRVIRIINMSESAYRSLVSRYVNRIREISSFIPTTRERVSWKDYGRILPGLGEKLSVPRAIIYTSAWYITGVPPVLLDADAIIELYDNDELDLVFKMIPSLLEEWKYEAQYYSRDVARRRLDDYIVRRIDTALDILGIKPEPMEPYIDLLGLDPVEPHILALGKIRGYLG